MFLRKVLLQICPQGPDATLVLVYSTTRASKMHAFAVSMPLCIVPVVFQADTCSPVHGYYEASKHALSEMRSLLQIVPQDALHKSLSTIVS